MQQALKDWFFDILRAPDTGEPLSLADDGCSLSAPTGTFSVEEGIPSFVNTEADEGKTVFNYAAHYTTDAEEFDYFGDETDSLTAAHLRLLRHDVVQQVPADARLLLDVGCGCAFVAERFAGRERRVVSLDIASANAHKALREYPGEGHAAVVADAYHLPFADGTFDCIIASEIIEHTVNPQGFVASLLSKLRPGGTLVISTPYKERIAYSLCIHCNCKTPHNAHLHSFDKAKMQHIVEPLDGEISRMRLVGNKLLLHSHLSMLLSHLGYGIWGFVDRVTNRLLPKAEHFVITVRKK